MSNDGYSSCRWMTGLAEIIESDFCQNQFGLFVPRSCTPMRHFAGSARNTRVAVALQRRHSATGHDPVGKGDTPSTRYAPLRSHDFATAFENAWDNTGFSHVAGSLVLYFWFCAKPAFQPATAEQQWLPLSVVLT